MASLYRAPTQTEDLFHHFPYEELPADIDDRFLHVDEFIDFASYRAGLMTALQSAGQSMAVPSGKRGLAPFDPVFMLKTLFLQGILNLGDRAFYSQLCCDLRLQRCLSLRRWRDIPKPATWWKYRNIFARQKVFQNIFALHLQQIRQRLPQIGTAAPIVASSFVECPRQHNTPAENRRIKQGQGHTLWRNQPAKRCHKDVDARWTKKRQETHYGYKAHFTVCATSKLILHVFSTPASVHDAAVIDQLLRAAAPQADLYADAGYVGKKQSRLIMAKNMHPFVCRKRFKNKSLTAFDRLYHHFVASIRCRIEPVFGFMERSLGGSKVRCSGQIRAAAQIALMSLLYNVFRLRFFVYKQT